MSKLESTRTFRVWISDGSGAPFTDLHKLRVSHPALLGRLAEYKGTIDNSVPVGQATVDSEREDDALFPEAEWCLTFPDRIEEYLESPERVDANTPVILQGMIEGKWINRLIGTSEWRPASIGNNLLAQGRGIATTLRAIEDGEIGDVLITYQYEREGRVLTRTQGTSLADLRGQSLLELVRAVLTYCRENDQKIDWIDFSAMGAAAAVVNEPARMQASLRDVALSPSDLTTLAGFQRLADHFARSILADGIGVPPDAPIDIEVRDQSGTIVGQGQLRWRSKRSA